MAKYFLKYETPYLNVVGISVFCFGTIFRLIPWPWDCLQFFPPHRLVLGQGIEVLERGAALQIRCTSTVASVYRPFSTDKSDCIRIGLSCQSCTPQKKSVQKYQIRVAGIIRIYIFTSVYVGRHQFYDACKQRLGGGRGAYSFVAFFTRLLLA